MGHASQVLCRGCVNHGPALSHRWPRTHLCRPSGTQLGATFPLLVPCPSCSCTGWQPWLAILFGDWPSQAEATLGVIPHPWGRGHGDWLASGARPGLKKALALGYSSVPRHHDTKWGSLGSSWSHLQPP